MKYRAIIADDEDAARSRLIRLLRQTAPDIEIVAEAGDGLSAVSLIDAVKPDLVFLDIRMPGKSGISVATDSVHKPFVIFATAFDNFAIESFKALTVDYLLKPIEESALRGAIEKFRSMSRRSNDFETLLADLAKRIDGSAKKKLAVPTGGATSYVDHDDIICFEADNKYTTIFTIRKESLVTETSLAELENTLPQDRFLRIHRKHIINTDYIAELIKWVDRRYKIRLTVPFGRELVVGRGYAESVRGRIGQAQSHS